MSFSTSNSVSVRLMGVLAVLAILFVSLPPAGTKAETAGTTATFRIGITTDGLYRFTIDDLKGALTAAGVDPGTVDLGPSKFSMTSLGDPIAIRVTGDQIEFFGQQFRSSLPELLDRQMEEKYTDERVYWLDIGGTAGPRVLDMDATPVGNPAPPTSFPTTVHAEVNRYWAPLWSLNYDTRDTWYWDRFNLPSGTVINKTYTFDTPYPAANFSADMRLELLPVIEATHQVIVSLGSTEVATASWNGKVRQVVTGLVSAGDLTGMTTSFDVQMSTPSLSITDVIYLNFWELDYRRLFRAHNDQLDFRTESGNSVDPQEFVATDFTSSPVAVWDITLPTQPKHLTGVAMSGVSGSYAALFRASPATNDHFWMQTESSSAAPASITLRPDTTWLRAPSVPENSGPGADTVIVTPLFLRPAAETLATWHRVHGRRTVVADLQDVYDEFNDGIRHPEAVRKMVACTADLIPECDWTAPAPAYLVLMGDGHFNLKNYDAASTYYPPAVNPVPPYLIFKDPWLGEIASDGLFGDYTGDDLPDVAVGRIPVNTLDEANIAVDKITTYDEGIRLQAWQQQAVFVADRIDPAAGDFWQLSDDIIQGYTPADLTAQRIYLGKKAPAPTYPTYANVTDATAAIRDAVNSGAFMVQYTGHGAVRFWSHDRLWTVTDAEQLTNGTKLPVILSFNCTDGNFIYSASFYQSLAETMFRQAGGGSVAAIAPSGDGVTPDQTAFRKILMDTMFKDGVRELGRALLVTKQKYAQAIGGMNYLVYELNLFGDPAMRLPVSGRVPQAPVVSIVRTGSTGSQVKLSWPAVTKDTLGADTMVTNYDIWRSTQPYFDADTTSCNCTKIDETAALSFVDTAIAPIGDVANNYFYVVRAQNSAGWSLASSSTGSSRTGEFDFALTPGSQ